jgi:hypothetical protein
MRQGPRNQLDLSHHTFSIAHAIVFELFRAAGSPAERSEFAQPDAAMLLTTISYYSDGEPRNCCALSP